MVVITGDTGAVELHIVRVESVTNNLQLTVKVSCSGFSGVYEEVWVTFQDLKIFTVDLQRLEKKREGKIVLESMSPDEFLLSLSLFNASSTINVTGYLRRLKYMQSTPSYVGIDFALTVDPSLMINILQHFQNLMSQAQ